MPIRLDKVTRDRLCRLVQQADEAGVVQSELIKAIAPIWGKSAVINMIAESRQKHSGKKKTRANRTKGDD